jgi:hypothetical protein
MKMHRSSFRKVGEYFYTDGADNVYFSIDDLFTTNELPDTRELRAVVMEDIQNILPGVLILE